MRISDFDFYKEYIRKKCGLNLVPSDTYLLDSRLTPVARKWGYPSLGAMTIALRGVPDLKLVHDVIEAVTASMGEPPPFILETATCRVFRETVMPYLLRNRRSREPIRLWCAGGESGQEAYSISMAVSEVSERAALRPVQILSSDISSRALEKGRSAVYSQFEAQQGLPVQKLLTHCENVQGSWRIREDIRGRVVFESFNLMDRMDDLGMFDLIICRNVLTAFDPEKRRDVLKRLSVCLPEDGFLLMGEKEDADDGAGTFLPHEAGNGLFLLKDGVYKSAETVNPGFSLKDRWGKKK